MVFFTCGTCGSSLKKNQVEKHIKVQCRNYQYVSCMDCSKDFWGDTYATHFKCITEDQKYGGSNFVAKENKGEKKQEAWIAKIQTVVAATQNMDPQLKALLNQIIGYDNIPRKKAKFGNFLKNSAKIRNNDLIARAWEVFEAANKKDTASENCNGVSATQNGTEGDAKENNDVAKEDAAPGEKLSKEERKKRKEEKKLRKLKDKEEKSKNNEENNENQDIVENGDVETNVEKSKKEKKKKKKKLQNDQECKGVEIDPKTDSIKLEGKKKRKAEEEVEHEVVENGDAKTEAKKSKKEKKKIKEQNCQGLEAMEVDGTDEPKSETEVKKKNKKNKRKHNPEETQGLAIDKETPEAAEPELQNQELTKEEKKEERRKQKLARKEERRRVERENVVSEDIPVINVKAKKKRKHADKDRDDTDEQIPKKKRCEDLNGNVEKEIVKSEEHSEVCNGVSDCQVEEEEENNSKNTGSTFKWKVVISKVLEAAPDKKLKVSKLRKKVLAEYYSIHGDSADSVESQNGLYALFGQKIKSGKFVIDKDYVKMKCK